MKRMMVWLSLALLACSHAEPADTHGAGTATAAPSNSPAKVDEPRVSELPADRRAGTTPPSTAPETKPVPRPVSNVVDIGFGDVTVHSGLALRSADRSRGLGGRTSLAPNEGLLFVYRNADTHEYWMKDCLMAIDILFVADDGSVIAMRTMDPPKPGAKDDELERFSSGKPCRLVLEVAPGFSAKHGIKVGSRLLLPSDMAALYGAADP